MVWYQDAYSFIEKLLNSVINPFLIGLIILLIGFIIGRIVAKLLKNVLHECQLDELLKKSAGISASFEEIISLIVKYIIYFIFVVMALNQMGVTSAVLTILSGGVIVILVISIFLGIKDFIPNLLSGLYLHRKGFLKKGTVIKVQNLEGEIINLGLLETKVKTKKEDIIVFPNSLLTKEVVVKKK